MFDTCQLLFVKGRDVCAFFTVAVALALGRLHDGAFLFLAVVVFGLLLRSGLAVVIVGSLSLLHNLLGRGLAVALFLLFA